MLSSSEATHILEMLKTSRPITFNINGIHFSTSYSDKIRVEYANERVESREISDPKEIHEYIQASENVSGYMKEPFNSWSYVKESRHIFEWQTDDGHVVTIDEDRKNNLVVSNPLPFEQEDEAFNEWGAAKFVSNLFLLRNNPKDVDYQVCRDDTAYSVFREIPGVGKETAEDIINRDIYSYEELLDNSRIIPRQYRKEAKEEIQERMDNGKIVLRDERLLDEFSDYMTAHKI